MKKFIVSSITALALVFGGFTFAQACPGKTKTTQVEKGKKNLAAPKPADTSKKSTQNPKTSKSDQAAKPAKI
ncbi:MAG: hypothetical protein KC609_03375 [Myxococcales bacterium]|nr:hypothetical protein [Myxococcales bacterium]